MQDFVGTTSAPPADPALRHPHARWRRARGRCAAPPGMPRGAAALPGDGRGGAGGCCGRGARRRREEDAAAGAAAAAAAAGGGTGGDAVLRGARAARRGRADHAAADRSVTAARRAGAGPAGVRGGSGSVGLPSPAGRRGYGSPRGRPARPAAVEAGGGSAVPAEGRALARRRCAVGWLRAGSGAAASSRWDGRSAPSCPAHRAAFHVPPRPSELFTSPSAWCSCGRTGVAQVFLSLPRCVNNGCHVTLRSRTRRVPQSERLPAAPARPQPAVLAGLCCTPGQQNLLLDLSLFLQVVLWCGGSVPYHLKNSSLLNILLGDIWINIEYFMCVTVLVIGYWQQVCHEAPEIVQMHLAPKR